MTETTRAPLPCIVCGKSLEAIFPTDLLGEDTTGGYVQPAGANTFRTSGTYGSTVFDPLDGSWLEINVCDPCVLAAQAAGRTREARD